MVLDLARVKTYLRIESDFTADDNEIQSMLDGAMIYFGNETNVRLTQESKVYNGVSKIYDFPIVNPDAAGLKPRANYYYNAECTDPLTLTVGYLTTDLIPDDIQQCILQIVKVWYYESEKESNTTLLPISVKQVINKYRRFWI